MRDLALQLLQAVQLRETGRFKEARRLLLELCERAPNNPHVQYQTAWVHDNLELEREAVGFYVRAIELGLTGEELAGALLGLGSTYRVLGQFEQSQETLQHGCEQFPERREFPVFLAMTNYNLGHAKEAVQALLQQLADTSSDPNLLAYRKALTFYAGDLDRLID